MCLVTLVYHWIYYPLFYLWIFHSKFLLQLKFLFILLHIRVWSHLISKNGFSFCLFHIAIFIVCLWFYDITLQKPIGLLSLLDEESNFPKATDLSFATKLKQHLSENSCFKGERGGAFSILHYAGEVSCPTFCFENVEVLCTDFHNCTLDLFIFKTWSTWAICLFKASSLKFFIFNNFSCSLPLLICL